jgi:hypothetical protein
MHLAGEAITVPPYPRQAKNIKSEGTQVNWNLRSGSQKAGIQTLTSVLASLESVPRLNQVPRSNSAFEN